MFYRLFVFRKHNVNLHLILSCDAGIVHEVKLIISTYGRQVHVCPVQSISVNADDDKETQETRARFLSLSQTCLRSVLDGNNLLSFLAETIWFSIAVLATRSQTAAKSVHPVTWSCLSKFWDNWTGVIKVLQVTRRKNLKLEYLRLCNKQPKENFVFYYTAIISQHWNTFHEYKISFNHGSFQKYWIFYGC